MALRALAAALVALVAGGWLMVVVVAAATGGDATAAAAWWLVLAGGTACVSGVVLGSSGQAAPAALIAVVAVAFALLAGAAAQPQAEPQAQRQPPPQPRLAERTAAVPAPAARAPERSRGNALPVPAPGPKAVVRSYYAALDAGDFSTAWASLSPAVQAAFGGFETWRHGYDSTLGHRVEDVAVAPGGVVTLVLVATDRTPCGSQTEQRFAVTWRLAGERATALSAVRLAGKDPVTACR